MSLQFLLMLVLAFAVVIAVLVARTLIHRRATEPDSAPADLAEIARWTARWRWSGVVLGLLLGSAAFLSAQRPVALGRLALASPALAAAAMIAGVVVGEATAHPSRTTTRTAALTTRSWRHLLPRTRTAVVGGGIGILTTLLVIGTWAGSPDDLGRAGRALRATCEVALPDSGTTMQTSISTPWPGSFYAGPAAIAVVACLALAAAGAVAIHRRANPSAASQELDWELRREAMTNLVTAVGVMAFGTAVPIATIMAMILSTNDCARGGDTFAGMLVVVAIGCAVVAAALLARLLLPRRRGLLVAPSAPDLSARPR